MLDPKAIADLTAKLAACIPEGAKKLPEDLQKHFQHILQEAFQKMQLVTKEDFEVQSKVLQRTREKMSALEARVTELEKTLKAKK